MPYCFQSGMFLSTLATISGGASLTAPVATRVFSRPGCGMYAMSGALPPLTRTGSWASNSLEPSYLIVTPVQSSNGLYEAWCGASSGAVIEV